MITRGVITSAIEKRCITPYVHMTEGYGTRRGGFRETKQPAEVRPAYARGAPGVGIHSTWVQRGVERCKEVHGRCIQ